MAASISATLIPCLKLFNRIQELVEQLDYRYELDVSPVTWIDELGRLRVWAANIGAHQTGQSSLEFRLRDASHISQQITKLLKDLENVLRDVVDELCNDQIKASQALVSSNPDDTYGDDEDLTPEIKQLYDEVVNIVDCLYKMSMLIRRPAQHDVIIGSHKNDAAAFEPFDKQHVRNKFLGINDETAQRLGRAITQRRKYLKYRDRHHAKLGKGIEEVQGIQGIHRTPTQSVLSETIATDFKTQNIDFEDATSNSGVSHTSYAPSLVGGGPITIPPPPKESAAGKPFECPYCFFLIEIKGTKSWTRHVFKDIKPYVCTFPDCSIPDRLYESRREWFFHMTTKHHVDNLTCPLCKDCLTSSKQFECHVARHLEELALFALPRGELDDKSDEDRLEAKAPTEGVPVDDSDEEGSGGTASDRDSEPMYMRGYYPYLSLLNEGETDRNAVVPFASESQDAVGTQRGHEDLWQRPRDDFLAQRGEEADKGYGSPLPVSKPSETSRGIDLDAYENFSTTDAEAKPRNAFSSDIEDDSDSDTGEPETDIPAHEHRNRKGDGLRTRDTEDKANSKSSRYVDVRSVHDVSTHPSYDLDVPHPYLSKNERKVDPTNPARHTAPELLIKGAPAKRIYRDDPYERVWGQRRTSEREPTRGRRYHEPPNPSVDTVRTRRRSLSRSYDRRFADFHRTISPDTPTERHIDPESFYEKTTEQSHDSEDKPTRERRRRRGVAPGAQDIEIHQRGENVTGGIVDQEMTAAAREALNATTAKYKMQKAARDKALELI